MNTRVNPLVGLLGNYGDSDDDSSDETSYSGKDLGKGASQSTISSNATVHPAPIPHCHWSACYDEGSGFTYYWNQITNAVTWEAPSEYLLALKIAQQHLNTSGSTEVSAEEWQMYQQALAEKQNAPKKLVPKAPISTKPLKPAEKPVAKSKLTNGKPTNKRRGSDDEVEKIELITSYYNSDSDSNDDLETTVKPEPPVQPVCILKPQNKVNKNPHKKQKIKPQVIEYGPSLPPNQNYSEPIGPELPPETTEKDTTKAIETTDDTLVKKLVEEKTTPKPIESEDSQDENDLLNKLRDKAILLQKLGGELPSELQKIISEETIRLESPCTIVEENTDGTKLNLDTNIDDLLDEIEKKELPKVKPNSKIDISVSDNPTPGDVHSGKSSPRSGYTPPREDIKPLFPSGKAVVEETKFLFPCVENIDEKDVETKIKPSTPPVLEEKKGANIYFMDTSESNESVNRKKRRIDNAVLPERKVNDTPLYTTKYSQGIEGFSTERTGLGFSKEEDQNKSPKNTINYGNGLLFTKGETLNEDKKDEVLDDLTDLVEAKLKFLCQQQPCPITPVQEMLIQMQTLASAFRTGALTTSYWRRWANAANASLLQHEAGAAPPGWACVFCRSEGRYRYHRDADGLMQWEYPAASHTDMDICTTPPPSDIEAKTEELPPPLPPAPPPPAASPPPPPPPPPVWRVSTPPPPAWNDPPPPGCDETPPPFPQPAPEPKKEIGDELLSFYNDIAELEKQTIDSAPNSPEQPPPRPMESTRLKETKIKEKESGMKDETIVKDKEVKIKEKERKVKEQLVKVSKKKSKVKISSSIGMKQKSVSSLVAKWQQVAEEINSD